MGLIQFAVLLSALPCSLVAGLVFTFAIVVMPGIKGLGDLAFLKSFKANDLPLTVGDRDLPAKPHAPFNIDAFRRCICGGLASGCTRQLQQSLATAAIYPADGAID